MYQTSEEFWSISLGKLRSKGIKKLWSSRLDDHIEEFMYKMAIVFENINKSSNSIIRIAELIIDCLCFVR